MMVQSINREIHDRMKLIYLILLFPVLLLGQTYYLDATDGNNGNTGLSPAQAWQTIVYAQSQIGANDSLLFQCTETWREQLTVPANSLYFGSYGTGAKPIIRAMTNYTDSSFTEQSSNLWFIATGDLSSDPEVLLHDDTLGIRVTSKAACDAQWEYFWTTAGDDTLFIYCDENPSSKATDLDIATYRYAIDIYEIDYTTVEDIQFEGGYTKTAFLWEATNTTFRNCTFQYSGGNLLQFHNGSSYGVVDSCTFDDWCVDGSLGYAIQVIGYLTTRTDSIVIKNSTFNATNYSGGTDRTAIMSGQNGWIALIDNNAINGNSGNLEGDGIIIYEPSDNASTIIIEDNTITDIGGIGIAIQSLEDSSATPTVIVRRNLIENSNLTDTSGKEALRLRNFTSASVCSVYYNIIDGTYDGTQTHDGIRASGADSVFIFNNVVYGADDGLDLSANNGDNTIKITAKNNIFSDNRGYGATAAASQTWTSLDYNLYYNNTTADTNNAGGNCVHGIFYSNPLFTVAGSNFIPQSSSPALNAGVDVGLTLDYVGNAVQSPPDIGAYEFSAASDNYLYKVWKRFKKYKPRNP